MNNYTASCSTWELHVRGPLAGPPIMYREYLKEASRCTIQVALYVALYDPLEILPFTYQAVSYVCDGVIRASMGPESIGTDTEIGFPYGFQDHAKTFLYNPVLDRWN